MPSAHGPIFCRRSENRFMCTDFCSDIESLNLFLELLRTKNRSMCADFSPMKNRSDIIQQWDLACYCRTQ